MSIFISYRRGVTTDITGRLHDWLERDFAREGVIRDVDSIPPGVRFWDHLQNELARCEAVVAVIGPEWDPKSMHDEDDFVRQEVEFALKKTIPIVPVLVGGAEMPSAEALPATMRDLVEFQALHVESGRAFKRNVAELSQALKRLKERRAAERAAQLEAERRRQEQARLAEKASAHGKEESEPFLEALHEARTSRLRRVLGALVVLFVIGLGVSGAAWWRADERATALELGADEQQRQLELRLETLQQQFDEEGKRARELQKQLEAAREEAKRRSIEAQATSDEATRKRLEQEAAKEEEARKRLELELARAKAERERLSKSAKATRVESGGTLKKDCMCSPGDPLCYCL